MDTSRRHFLRLGGLATMAGSAGIVRSPLLDAEPLAASPGARSLRFPRPLRSGDVMGITSPSAGVKPALRPRMRFTYQTLNRLGYAYREGECLWGRSLLSAPARQRAEELTRMLLDDAIGAIFPPNGGELLLDMLPFVDFERLGRTRPKWMLGYSDMSTFMLPYTLKTGIATLSGTNLWECPIRSTERIARRSRPDIVITLNPDEAWTHPEHRGLGRLVGRLHRTGVFDRPGASRPRLFGLREHGRYAESLRPQVGDESFDRLAWSPVLKATYADDWRRATASYVSQSSHPVWFAARAAAGLLPGYGARDMIRQLNCGACAEGLGRLLRRYPPAIRRLRALPEHPRIHRLGR